MYTILQDLRYAVRSLLRTPGMTLTALITLALGIGANTALFSLINGVFLAPPPGVEQTDDLLWISDVSTEYGSTTAIGMTYPLFSELRERADLFAEIAVFRTAAVDFSAGGAPERLNAEVVSGNYFSILRIDPALGRGFLPEEDNTPATHPVTVIAYDLWQTRFGGASDIVGRAVSINGSQFTVIGVAPAGFRGVRDLRQPADLWVPTMTYPVVLPSEEDPLGVDYGVRNFQALGRLSSNVPAERVAATIDGLLRGLAVDYPQAYDGLVAGLYPFRGIAGPLVMNGDIVVALFGAALTLIVLLIACGNVANLLLARAAGRRREIAIRAAIGASRRRIVRQLLVESLVLAVAGGAAAILVATWMIDLFFAVAPLSTPVPVALDTTTLLVTFSLAVGTGIVVGLSPALRSSRADVTSDLKGTNTGGSAGLRPQAALVASQLALSCMMLIGAALIVRMVWETVMIDRRVPAREQVIALTFDLRTRGYTDENALTLKERLLERAAAVPGVESVTLLSAVPYDHALYSGRAVTLENHTDSGREPELVDSPRLHVVRPDFLQTLMLPLVRGRDLSRRDVEEAPTVVLINEAAAARYWPGEDALGKRLRMGADTLPWSTVVGVVSNARFDIGREGTAEPAVYTAELQRGPLGPQVTLLARGRGDALELVPPLRGAVHAIDPDLPIYRIRTLGEIIDQNSAEGRITGALMLAVGGLALILALIGLHGVVAYTVEQRTREVGIRVALGASRSQVLRLFSGDVLRVAGVGVGVGLLLAAGVVLFLRSMISELRALDIGTFAVVAALLVAVALLASYFPARRATRVDPMVALRAE